MEELEFESRCVGPPDTLKVNPIEAVMEGECLELLPRRPGKGLSVYRSPDPFYKRGSGVPLK